MLQKLKYELIILLNEEFNENELKTWAFKYAKELQKLGGSNISVTSKGKKNTAYKIKKQNKCNLIEFFFSVPANKLEGFTKTINLDENVLRSLILKKITV
jgi:ribosomal protein S6